MPRLIDRLISETTKPKWVHSRYAPDKSIAHTEVLVVDNVARYYLENHIDYCGPYDFPNIAPPFENMFIEFNVPKNQEFIPHSILEQVGAHIVSIDTTLNASTYPVVLKKEPFDALMKLNPRWIMVFSLQAWGDGGWRYPDLTFVFAVDNDGQLLGIRYADSFTDKTEHDRIIDWHLRWVIAPIFLALSFLHCKNVTLIQQIPPAPLSKKFQKNHGRPLFRYRILDIEPMRHVLRTEGNSEKTGLKQALHICRGHFKDYSKGGGLFGKYKGLYWWESHVRGSLEQGIADKDYRVKEPKATQ